MARTKTVSPPEVGSKAPEFNLPSAQGGQIRLSLRTVHQLVIVAFYRGSWSEECVEYFKALAEREREINLAGATLVGIGPAEPEEAREFVRSTGIKSYILYDYVRVMTREYGLLQKDPDHGDTARPAVFLIGTDHEVLRAWLDERPAPGDLLAEVSGITGLPREPEEEEEGEEKPKKRPKKAAEGETGSEAGEAADAEKPASEERSARRKASRSQEAPEGDAETGDTSGTDEASNPETESGQDPPKEDNESGASTGEPRNGAETTSGKEAEAPEAQTQEDDGPARGESR